MVLSRSVRGPGRQSPPTIPQQHLWKYALAYTTELTDSVGVAGSLRRTPTAEVSDVVAITDSLTIAGVFVQFDSWRPVPKPDDNSLMLVCRTPENYHDSLVALQHLSLWTIRPDGSDEHPVLTDPTINGFGWVRQSHPEWSPDGQTIVLMVETATEYQLVLMNSSAFGL